MTSVEGALDTCHEALRVARLRCRACRGPQRCSAARRPRRTPPRATSRCREASRASARSLAPPARRSRALDDVDDQPVIGLAPRLRRAPRLVAGQGDAGRRAERRGRAVQRQAEKPGGCGRRRKRRPAFGLLRTSTQRVRARGARTRGFYSAESTNQRARRGCTPPSRRSATARRSRAPSESSGPSAASTARWCCTSGWCSAPARGGRERQGARADAVRHLPGRRRAPRARRGRARARQQVAQRAGAGLLRQRAGV